MTAIVVWRNEEIPAQPSLWVAADSRVSTASGSTLLEDAAKVLTLPVVCRWPGPEGFFSEIGLAHSLGYCFAGSTLMGQNAYLALVPLLGNLCATGGYVPAMYDIATFVHRFLRLTFDGYKVRVGEGAVFEVCLFGFCPRTGELEAYRFYPTHDDDAVVMACDALGGLRDGAFVYLGDCRAVASARIEAALGDSSQPAIAQYRSPRRVIQQLIDDPGFPTIGGDVQLGIANAFGFRPYKLMKPRPGKAPSAYISYLGHDLTEDLFCLGDAIVGGETIV